MSKRTRKRAATRRAAASPPRRGRAPSLEDLAGIVVLGGRDILDVEDPLEAEQWASAMLGTFYKLPLPLDVRDEVHREIVPTIARLAEARADPGARVALDALASVAGPDDLAPLWEAASRLAERGLAAPAWVDELGTAELTGAWIVTDVFGDHEGYYAVFAYPGRRAHLVTAMVDKALGEIVKDASVGYLAGDPGETLATMAAVEPGIEVSPVDPAAMARRVVDAIESGDLYLDNAWTDEFKRTRALLLARMRGLPLGPVLEPVEVPDEERAEIVEAFRASAGAPTGDEVEVIVATCLDYTCDYLGDGPYRWSPIVVEQFLLDYVPRKASLSLGEVRALPGVLRSWVRFALGRRGLDEEWIKETEVAVDTFEREFLAEATNPDNFGPAKAVVMRMLADGVDLADAAAVEAWIQEENDRQ